MLSIIKHSSNINKPNKCHQCNKKFHNTYKYNKLTLKESDIHELIHHNRIIEYTLISTNDLNIIDALYESGSNKIYIDINKNIQMTGLLRYSEHFGLLNIKDKKVNKITVLTKHRIDKNDKMIYLPGDNIELLNVNYIFHTHPKTPYIASRISDGMLYESPSTPDILHFVDHHNMGKLLGSIVIAPEGLYIIRKYNFTRDNIKIDSDIIIDELDEINRECFEDQMLLFKDIPKNISNIDGNIKLSEEYFYTVIANNFSFINKINSFIKKFDIFIDYYPRTKLKKSNQWLFPDIYIPVIK